MEVLSLGGPVKAGRQGCKRPVTLPAHPNCQNRTSSSPLSCPQYRLLHSPAPEPSPHTHRLLGMHLPTLKHFILKQQALDLFRSAIRASRCNSSLSCSLPQPSGLIIGSLAIPDVVARKETIAWIRAEFERKRHLQDVVLAMHFLVQLLIIPCIFRRLLRMPLKQVAGT